jgi:ferredoxin-fold anticodon binding domain-containing protein
MIILFDNFKFYKKGLDIAYSGVILDSKSRELLLSIFIYPNQNFSDWIKIADHLTICMGELPEHLKRYWLDEEVILTATDIGISDKAVAVKISDFFNISKSEDDENRFPHITLAINSIDAKPVDSNKIVNWKKIEPLKLKGVIKEIPGSYKY